MTQLPQLRALQALGNLPHLEESEGAETKVIDGEGQAMLWD